MVERKKIRLSDESGFFMFFVTYEGFIMVYSYYANCV